MPINAPNLDQNLEYKTHSVAQINWWIVRR